MEEITPIIPKNNTQTIVISSNENVTVTVYNNSFTRTVKHYPNQTQGTYIEVPTGVLNYSSSCGASGIVTYKQIYIGC